MLVQEEDIGVHAKPWQSEMHILHKDVQALCPNTQDMDWLFCFNNPLAPEMTTMSLPVEFIVPKEMFEGRRDPRAHIM
ncbi:hypothetical protein J1N35_033621 [Gossypium stocksii]|uniref:Uncharacterized protein n=1 Tax=Gossypium stocksii TaxID=47602 RepID=A0A9D3UQQ9_9ROSI|nr:hypothetical protein J1N35_033621 [Gossypium stocksii]